MINNKRDNLKKEDVIRELDINKFDNIIKQYSISIIKLYDICLDRLNRRKEINLQLSDLNGMLIDFRFFINNTVKNNKDLLSNDRFKDIILRTRAFIHELDKDYNNLKVKNNKFNNNINKKKNVEKNIVKKKVNSNLNVDELVLVDKYLECLLRDRELILQNDPNKKNFLDGTINYLSNIVLNKNNMYKGDIRVILDNIKISLLEQFNYNIEEDNNKIIDNIPYDDDKYISLLASIDNYIRNYEKKKALIVDNLLILGDDKDRLDYYNYYEEILYNLSIEVFNRSRSVDEMSKEFNNIKRYIKNKLGYEYRIDKNKRYRRR